MHHCYSVHPWLSFPRSFRDASTMSTHSIRGLTSIIVPCWNQLEFTRQCITALKNHTRPPWELIAIDNGSTDGTGVYLAGVRDLAGVPVTIVSNATNRGFPAAINQGLHLSRGEYLVLLNNDVIVTDGWLDQLIALAHAKGQSAFADKDRNGAALGRPSDDTDAGSGDPQTTGESDRDELAELAERPNVTIIDLNAAGEDKRPGERRRR